MSSLGKQGELTVREGERGEGIGRTHLFWGSASAARTALSGEVGMLGRSRSVGDAALKEDRYLKGWMGKESGNMGEESLGIGMMGFIEGNVRDF